ncbi:hypothetical protein [Pedobacter sp. D749]|uniref:hypothetical protein n=1 Tax=Pedobacter sp. D749 TaxID=2856523 RepID=UPI001C574DE0|nr:hypothetical protein [Pedobacter sp. D749]QXU40332.1 hypothetical protein KYH19_15120 [Pedobacter sp. D749]
MDTSLGLGFLYVLLACFNKFTGFTEERRQSQGQENQKNRSSSLQFAQTNLKRSGFVFVITELKLKIALNTKQSAAVFLMCVRLCKRPIAGLTSALGTLALQSTMPPRHRAEKINIYFQSIVFKISKLSISMTIDLGNDAKNKCKLKDMCPHDRVRLGELLRSPNLKLIVDAYELIGCFAVN